MEPGTCYRIVVFFYLDAPFRPEAAKGGDSRVVTPLNFTPPYIFLGEIGKECVTREIIFEGEDELNSNSPPNADVSSMNK